MNTTHKPYSESCDQNRVAILDVIRPILKDNQAVLEIGSGTGQHAVYFARNLPHLHWHTSDRSEYLSGINMWIEEAALHNISAPVELDVTATCWPDIQIDAVFSANTCHIMHWQDVVALFKGVGALLPVTGQFVLYGPFNYGGNYTSDSNSRFDDWLKSRDTQSGIRDFEALNQLAIDNKMKLTDDYPMPANNRILHWTRIDD